MILPRPESAVSVLRRPTPIVQRAKPTIKLILYSPVKLTQKPLWRRDRTRGISLLCRGDLDLEHVTLTRKKRRLFEE